MRGTPRDVVSLYATWDTAGLFFCVECDRRFELARLSVVCWLPDENCDGDAPGYDLGFIVDGYRINVVQMDSTHATAEVTYDVVGLSSGGTIEVVDSVHIWELSLRRMGGRWRIVNPSSQNPPARSVATALRRHATAADSTALLAAMRRRKATSALGTDARDSVAENALASGISLRGFDVVLETTTLADVVGHFGAGAVTQSGDAGAATNALCFGLEGPAPGGVVLLESSAVGGSDQRITSYRVIADRAPDATCTGGIVKASDVRLANGIRLGMTAERIRQLLPNLKSTSAAGDIIRYERVVAAAPLRGRPGETYKGAELRFIGAAIIELHGWSVTTY